MKTKRLKVTEIPDVNTIGGNDNAFVVLTKCYYAAKLANWDDERIAHFMQVATILDYKYLRLTVKEYFHEVQGDPDDLSIDTQLVMWLLKHTNLNGEQNEDQ